jgi:phage gp46-like protein
MPRIRIIEGDEPAAVIGWDTVWGGDIPDVRLYGAGEWAIADPTDPLNQNNYGGLQAQNPLRTAIILCLFTNRRLPRELPDGLPEVDQDAPRYGWHGDTFDIDYEAGERPLGSLLYTLDRADINEQTAMLMEWMAQDALQTLLDQGVASNIETFHQIDELAGRMTLRVRVTTRKGDIVEVEDTPVVKRGGL